MAWTRGSTIGQGSSAVVSLATASEVGGELFAVKSTDLSSSTFLQKEENLITQLCSPYIVKCLGSDITRENNKPLYNIFLEYIPGGTLSDQIKRHGGSFEENAIRSHAYEILRGLNYLHQKGVAHCDIKGQNILIGDDWLKIADFGCAKWVGSDEPNVFSGTPAYMAPEVARGEEQSFPADVWALGCTIIEMATGSTPWPEMKDPAAALYRIAFSGDLPETPCWFSDAAKDMLTKCLMKDPRERWTGAQLLKHPFFDSVTKINCGEVKKFTKESPTSIMDQGIWDAMEEPGCSANPAEIASSLYSPLGRVRALIGENIPASLNFPDWGDEEHWLTVRGDATEECPIVESYEDLLYGESSVAFSSGEEEGIQIQSLISIEDFLTDYYCFDEQNSSTFPVTLTETVNVYFLYRIVKFKNYVQWNYSEVVEW